MHESLAGWWTMTETENVWFGILCGLLLSLLALILFWLLVAGILFVV